MNNQTENARKIQHEQHITELPKNETIKFLPFSLFLSFETAQKIFANKYETVKMIITSFDFHMNKTALNETPKDISNFVLFEKAKKLVCLKK